MRVWQQLHHALDGEGAALNLSREVHVEICSNCHPFYTGQQKIVDTAGRVERFRKKYAKVQNKG